VQLSVFCMLAQPRQKATFLTPSVSRRMIIAEVWRGTYWGARLSPGPKGLLVRHGAYVEPLAHEESDEREIPPVQKLPRRKHSITFPPAFTI
jgi:hypothetical protein